MPNTSNQKPGESESKRFATSQIEKLRAAYHGLGWDDGQIRLYKAVLTDLAVSYGPQRVEKGVTQCILSETFLEPAKLKQHIPPAEIDRKRCASCAETEGWLYVTIPGETRARVKKCLH